MVTPNTSSDPKDDENVENLEEEEDDYDDRIVTLNVGGIQRFVTFRSTVVQNKVLRRFIERAEKNPTMYMVDNGTSVFIDRDPKHFGTILQYLRDRTGQIGDEDDNDDKSNGGDELRTRSSSNNNGFNQDEVRKHLKIAKQRLEHTQQYLDLKGKLLILPKDPNDLKELYREAMFYEMQKLRDDIDYFESVRSGIESTLKDNWKTILGTMITTFGTYGWSSVLVVFGSIIGLLSLLASSLGLPSLFSSLSSSTTTNQQQQQKLNENDLSSSTEGRPVELIKQQHNVTRDTMNTTSSATRNPNKGNPKKTNSSFDSDQQCTVGDSMKKEI